MYYDRPKEPKRTWAYGINHLLRPIPKFALRLGVALSAVSITGFGYTVLSDSHPEWAKWMGVMGLIGVFLTTFFGKK